MKLLTVVDTRLSFLKAAALLRAVEQHNASAAGPPIEHVLVHAGRDGDARLAATIFAALAVPGLHHRLGIDAASACEQTASILRRLDPVLAEERPDLVVVIGDATATVAAALAAAMRQVPIAHVDAGQRGLERSPPEELNRLVTDAISTLLFASSVTANETLNREAHLPERVFFVGNVLVDTLLWCRPQADRSPILEQLGLTPGDAYLVAALRDRDDADEPDRLVGVIRALAELRRDVPVVVPMHPYTLAQLERSGLRERLEVVPLDRPAPGTLNGKVSIVPPLGYFDFLRLIANARLVLTDSSGVQEETTCLGVPCLNVREHRERPVTAGAPISRTGGGAPDRIVTAARSWLERPPPRLALPELWDGHAAARIVAILARQG